jgi:hypothetical protein
VSSLALRMAAITSRILGMPQNDEPYYYATLEGQLDIFPAFLFFYSPCSIFVHFLLFPSVAFFALSGDRFETR